MIIKLFSRSSALVATAILATGSQVVAAPSVPYMPSWQARHHLQMLSDEADLQITTTHWPLPSLAVQNALNKLPEKLSSNLQESKAFVLKEIARQNGQNKVEVNLRFPAEGPVGYGENYTPGSSVKLTSKVATFGDVVPLATKLGVRIEQNPNSLQTSYSGVGKEGAIQGRLDDTALVAEKWGVNFQAFAHQNWWGPGWQTSLVNGNNIPAWMGVGIQRSEVTPSESKWLSWLGPWNLELSVAKAQDPVVFQNQPDGYIFSGARLTIKPFSWLELGASRGMQTGGAGRKTSISSLWGGGTHTFENSTIEDTSNQVAGYDARIRCPSKLNCSIYFQSIGEDANGNFPHLPNKFMSLSGAEFWSAGGQHRFFTEFMQTYMKSWPGDNKDPGGYRNWSYPQGYTNGARWIGSSFGGDARVFTLGWFDAKNARMVKFHTGETSTMLGSYVPNSNAPHGKLWGLTANQRFEWDKLMITPELTYTHLEQGQSIGYNRNDNWRVGVNLSRYF